MKRIHSFSIGSMATSLEEKQVLISIDRRSLRKCDHSTSWGTTNLYKFTSCLETSLRASPGLVPDRVTSDAVPFRIVSWMFSEVVRLFTAFFFTCQQGMTASPIASFFLVLGRQHGHSVAGRCRRIPGAGKSRHGRTEKKTGEGVDWPQKQRRE